METPTSRSTRETATSGGTEGSTSWRTRLEIGSRRRMLMLAIARSQDAEKSELFKILQQNCGDDNNNNDNDDNPTNSQWGNDYNKIIIDKASETSTIAIAAPPEARKKKDKSRDVPSTIYNTNKMMIHDENIRWGTVNNTHRHQDSSSSNSQTIRTPTGGYSSLRRKGKLFLSKLDTGVGTNLQNSQPESVFDQDCRRLRSSKSLPSLLTQYDRSSGNRISHDLQSKNTSNRPGLRRRNSDYVDASVRLCHSTRSLEVGDDDLEWCPSDEPPSIQPNTPPISQRGNALVVESLSEDFSHFSFDKPLWSPTLKNFSRQEGSSPSCDRQSAALRKARLLRTSNPRLASRTVRPRTIPGPVRTNHRFFIETRLHTTKTDRTTLILGTPTRRSGQWGPRYDKGDSKDETSRHQQSPPMTPKSKLWDGPTESYSPYGRDEEGAVKIFFQKLLFEDDHETPSDEEPSSDEDDDNTHPSLDEFEGCLRREPTGVPPRIVKTKSDAPFPIPESAIEELSGHPSSTSGECSSPSASSQYRKIASETISTTDEVSRESWRTGPRTTSALLAATDKKNESRLETDPLDHVDTIQPHHSTDECSLEPTPPPSPPGLPRFRIESYGSAGIDRHARLQDLPVVLSCIDNQSPTCRDVSTLDDKPSPTTRDHPTWDDDRERSFRKRSNKDDPPPDPADIRDDPPSGQLTVGTTTAAEEDDTNNSMIRFRDASTSSRDPSGATVSSTPEREALEIEAELTSVPPKKIWRFYEPEETSTLAPSVTSSGMSLVSELRDRCDFEIKNQSSQHSVDSKLKAFTTLFGRLMATPTADQKAGPSVVQTSNEQSHSADFAGKVMEGYHAFRAATSPKVTNFPEVTSTNTTRQREMNVCNPVVSDMSKEKADILRTIRSAGSDSIAASFEELISELQNFVDQEGLPEEQRKDSWEGFHLSTNCSSEQIIGVHDRETSVFSTDIPGHSTSVQIVEYPFYKWADNSRAAPIPGLESPTKQQRANEITPLVSNNVKHFSFGVVGARRTDFATDDDEIEDVEQTISKIEAVLERTKHILPLTNHDAQAENLEDSDALSGEPYARKSEVLPCAGRKEEVNMISWEGKPTDESVETVDATKNKTTDTNANDDDMADKYTTSLEDSSFSDNPSYEASRTTQVQISSTIASSVPSRPPSTMFNITPASSLSDSDSDGTASSSSFSSSDSDEDDDDDGTATGEYWWNRTGDDNDEVDTDNSVDTPIPREIFQHHIEENPHTQSLGSDSTYGNPVQEEIEAELVVTIQPIIGGADACATNITKPTSSHSHPSNGIGKSNSNKISPRGNDHSYAYDDDNTIMERTSGKQMSSQSPPSNGNGKSNSNKISHHSSDRSYTYDDDNTIMERSSGKQVPSLSHPSNGNGKNSNTKMSSHGRYRSYKYDDDNSIIERGSGSEKKSSGIYKTRSNSNIHRDDYQGNHHQYYHSIRKAVSPTRQEKKSRKSNRNKIRVDRIREPKQYGQPHQQPYQPFQRYQIQSEEQLVGPQNALIRSPHHGNGNQGICPEGVREVLLNATLLCRCTGPGTGCSPRAGSFDETYQS